MNNQLLLNKTIFLKRMTEFKLTNAQLNEIAAVASYSLKTITNPYRANFLPPPPPCLFLSRDMPPNEPLPETSPTSNLVKRSNKRKREQFKEIRDVNILFYVSNKGRVKKTLTFAASYGRFCRGYMRYGGKYNVPMDRAVYVAFKGFSDDPLKNTIDHKDNNPTNNCLENLRWMSQQEQIRKSWAENENRRTSSSVTGKPVKACKIGVEPEVWVTYPTVEAAADACKTTQGNVSNTCAGRFKSSMGFKFRFADTGVPSVLVGEEWRPAIVSNGKICKWFVSNFGRVKSPTGIISYGWNDFGYMKIASQKSFYFVHNLVAYTFIGPPPPGMINPTIDHIDRNSSNNHVSNLRWATKKNRQ